MKLKLSVLVGGFAIVALSAGPAVAVDFEYFKSQSCEELGKEFDALTKAEATINDSIKKKDSDANVKLAVGFLLTGWPFWGTADHGNANAQLAEIREDLRFVTRAQKANNCKT